MFGNPETTTGGNALKFYASVRLDIRKSGAAIKDKEGNMVGNQVKVKVVKNKLAPPFRVAQFDIVFGEGISKNGEIIDLGTDFEVIQKSGAWYSYNGAKIAQGRDSAKQFLHDNPEVADEIELKIKDKISAGTTRVGAQAASMVMLEDDMAEE
jgi:recombination protein RecA